MRTPTQARAATSPAGSRRTKRPRARAGAVAALCSALLALALGAPGGALADSMSLSAPEAVQELASQISFTAVSEEPVYAVLGLNNPGVPCAPDPDEDDGQIITQSHLLDGGTAGTFSGAADYTPPSTGIYTACGWLEIPAGLLEMDGGPVTAATSLPVSVRVPHISLALSFPRRPEPGRRFALDLSVSSEVQREIVVEGLPLTSRGCPVNYGVEEAQHLIDKKVTGGPVQVSSIIDPLTAGAYIFCAWADPPGDGSLDPEASTSLILRLPGTQTKRRAGKPKHRKRGTR